MLGEAEVHLWSSSLSLRESSRDKFYRTLSAEERERAANFRFPEHRDAYIVSRGLLRAILSQYSNEAPERLVISYGSNGKPRLVGAPIYFNVAHSGQRVVFAIAREQMLGVDIELVRLMPNLEEIAMQFFSVPEYEDLLQVPEQERVNAFFRCWTRKEAYVKATGDGLQERLDQFQVSLKPGEPAKFVVIDAGRADAGHWSLFDWSPEKGYAGAIAVYGTGWQLIEIPAARVQNLIDP